MSDLPEWAKDRLTTHVDIHFDWKDRLKILFGPTVFVTVKVDTENLVGRNEGQSRISVGRIFPSKDRPMYAVEPQSMKLTKAPHE